MNWNFNFLITCAAFSTLLFITGCKGNSSTESTSADGIAKDSTDQHQPEGNGNRYRMKIETKPDIVEAGKQAVFSFTPQIVGKETEPVPLDVAHGYEIHLIMVSEDLSWFDHRHPGLSDLGSYDQVYTFEKGGIYILYADYTPTGSTDTFQMQQIPVNGNSSRALKYNDPKLTSSAGPFEVNISPATGGNFESGKMQYLHATISKGGTPVDPNTLGDYLGGKGHLVIISVKDKDYLHVHPSVEDGHFVFHTHFSKPGMYRAWLQFQTENLIQTADFVLNVDQGPESAKNDSNDKMHPDQH